MYTTPIAILIFFSFLLFIGRSFASVECLADQSSSLLQLKEGFSFPSHELVSWKPGSNCCNWEGVTCDSESGRVIGLDLSGCNISGTIGGSLFDLASLQTLNLAYNQFELVPVPSGFERLVHLSWLNLSNSGFVGQIPIGISYLTELVSLDLSTSCDDVTPAYSFRLENPDLQTLVGKLRNLKELFLDCVSLSNGTEWYKALSPTLPQLQVLSLKNCNLSGVIPEDIFQFRNLKVLDLSDNQIHGQIPRSLFKLSGLQFLGLASNNFNGTLELDSFHSLSNLTFLDLSSNKLFVRDNDGNSSPTSFPKISTLKLVSCNLTNIPTLLKYQDRMTTLDLSNNRIAGDVPKWIWSIGNQTLTSLNLSYNLFTHVEGSMPEFSYNSKFSPVILDLRSNMLRGPIPLPPRETTLLDYSNNYFSSIIPFNISYYLNSTIFFSLANNSLTGEIPSTICNASSLQILDLSDNLLSGSIPPCILKHRNNLIVLNLRGNKLKGKIPHHISKRCGLRTINLNNNYLEGGVPLSLANCNDLEVIDLGNNRIVDVFPYWLGNIYILRILVLRSNGFYGSMVLPSFIPHNNYTFTKLQILDLSSNNFSGSLPPDCFLNLKAMTLKSQPNSSIVGEFVHPQLKQLSEGFFYHDTVVVTSKGRDTKLVKILTIYNYIDLSNNNFEGSIPDILGQLQSLCELNLSHNTLTGQIPATFGNMMQLESLDLSSNRLAGGIPHELSFLTFLSFLNLSNNNLVGRIPQGNQFSTFTNTSYQGNGGLCGSPLSKQCGDANPSSTILESPPSESDEGSSDEIWLALSIGLGYGFGIAMVFVLQNVPVREWKKVRQWLFVF